MTDHEWLLAEEARVLQAGADLMERIERSDRARAVAKFHRDPSKLTDREKHLLVTAGVLKPDPPIDRAADQRKAELIAVMRPSWLIFRNADIERWNTHAIDVALRHQLTAVECAHDQQHANIQSRTVFTPPISNAETYASFFHEAGHIVSPDGDARQYRYNVRDRHVISPGGEVGAWRWAVREIGRGWTRAMQQELYTSLQTYTKSANADERELFTACVTEAALQITDRPWTFQQLEFRCKELRGDEPATFTDRMADALRKKLATP